MFSVYLCNYVYYPFFFSFLFSSLVWLGHTTNWKQNESYCNVNDFHHLRIMCCRMRLNRVNLISLCLLGAMDFTDAWVRLWMNLCVCEIVRVCTYMRVSMSRMYSGMCIFRFGYVCECINECVYSKVCLCMGVYTCVCAFW